MKKNKILSMIAIFLLTCSFTLTGCGLSKAKVKPPKEANKTVNHEKMTKQLKEENGVADGKVYLKSDIVKADIKIKDNIDQNTAKKLADKYANDLKKEYKDMPVSVKVDKSNKEVIKEQIPAKDTELAGQAKAFMGVEYTEINLRDIQNKNITKILLNDKQLIVKKDYDISDGKLKIIKTNDKSKIRVITSDKTYNVVFLK